MHSTDPYAGAAGRFYSFYIARRRLGRLVGRALWASDFRPLYRQLDGLRELSPGVVLLDVACGAGLALRWLDPAAGVRYIGVDASPAMLRRARRQARRRGHDHVELHLADAALMPLPDAAADVGLLCNALHCVADPEAVLGEMVRCLKPGAAVIGSMLVRGNETRADRLMDADTLGLTDSGGSDADLRGWLGAHLLDVQVQTTDALACFTAKTPDVTAETGTSQPRDA